MFVEKDMALTPPEFEELIARLFSAEKCRNRNITRTHARKAKAKTLRQLKYVYAFAYPSTWQDCDTGKIKHRKNSNLGGFYKMQANRKVRYSPCVGNYGSYKKVGEVKWNLS